MPNNKAVLSLFLGMMKDEGFKVYFTPMPGDEWPAARQTLERVGADFAAAEVNGLVLVLSTVAAKPDPCSECEAFSGTLCYALGVAWNAPSLTLSDRWRRRVEDLAVAVKPQPAAESITAGWKRVGIC